MERFFAWETSKDGGMQYAVSGAERRAVLTYQRVVFLLILTARLLSQQAVDLGF